MDLAAELGRAEEDVEEGYMRPLGKGDEGEGRSGSFPFKYMGIGADSVLCDSAACRAEELGRLSHLFLYLIRTR